MKKSVVLSVCLIVLAALSFLWVAETEAYQNYELNGQGCSQCHPGFLGGIGDALHNLHVTQMTGNCQLCHTIVGDDPKTNDSGDAEGEGCRGCHGVNPDPGGPANNLWGAGLRLHHFMAGAPPDSNGLFCISCHTNDPVPPSEDTIPVYYMRDDVSVKEPCQASPAPPGEDFSGDTFGLDNDGDLLYDADDPDCAASVCGNSVIEAGEECDDGNTLDGDCCSADCMFEPVGSSCADGLFCNGAETCDGAGSCQAGAAVDCGDGVGCTDDACDEVNGCTNTANDANCPDDGMFCNGSEFCDALNDCSSTGDPCPAGTVCNETVDICEAVAACGNGVLETGEECDDGNTLDGDCCSADCMFEPAGSSCADGQFCNGAETCDGAGNCAEAVSACQPFPDGCVIRNNSCDEVNDTCTDFADDSECSDGLFCNGAETCDINTGSCQAGAAVDCGDGVGCTDDACDEVNGCTNTANDANCPDDGMFCNGSEFCDALNDCSSTGDPCPAGTVCNETVDICEAVAACGNGVLETGEECDDGNTLDGDCCSADCMFEPAGSSCADGQFCNGAEMCDGAGSCQAGTPVNCSDNVGCTVDSCDEIDDTCVNIPNDNLCPDDGMFCTGQEVCDPVLDCVSTGDPCPAGTSCNETTDICDTVGGKVTICHIPKGNPGKAHTITIDAESVPDHLAHGDVLGEC